MSLIDELAARAGGACELCRRTDALEPFPVPPDSDGSAEQSALLCGGCRGQIGGGAAVESAHWAPLAETMWTPVPAVQVLAWRMLRRLRDEGWAAELLEMLYLDDETRGWAELEPAPAAADAAGPGAGGHRDAHGTPLASGDTVTLIKDLVVRGAGFTAKRGTAVRNITVVADNPAHIEGRVEGQRIVILTEFVKKG